jgi:DNA polymerase III epsilon subunit-like protein
MANSNTTNSRVLSIDVECVATSRTHDGRAPCSVAVVDEKCQIIFSSLIKPKDKVVSDLFPLTGLRIKDLEGAPSLEEVLEKVRFFAE